jgi:SAM-dependent methyltransferase
VESLDHAFLRWLPVVPEEQKAYHSVYLPFFEGCQTVVDLGCGEGHFVELLAEHGIHAIGVDSDRECCRAAQERGINVVHQDALEYLAGLEAESIDGVFAAHLVEHLAHEAVIELLRRAHRALKPGGVIVLTTPNVRGLFSHLEMFYLHFGHVTFYHPRLLGFFLEFVGFTGIQAGENPRDPHPLFADILEQLAARVAEERPADVTVLRLHYDPQLPRPRNPFRRLIWHGKMFLVRLIVQPYLDHFMTEINTALQSVEAELARLRAQSGDSRAELAQVLERLDRSFEAYVVARKPSGASHPE